MMMKRLIFLTLVVSLILTGYMYHIAKSDPIVRETYVTMTSWPKAEPTIKLLLVSDVHVAGPDMPPGRLSRIVEQMNFLKPDIILFAGDFVSDKTVATYKYSAKEALAPLAGLKPSLGSIAVLGNHDHGRNKSAIVEELRKNGVTVLNNEATEVGPLVIGGLDDDFTGNTDIPRTLGQMGEYEGIRVALSHSPDVFPDIPKDISLILAGHTHCGQIVLPLFGPLSTASRYGRRYSCGVIKEDGKTMIVGAGLGTSILPLRLGAVPDMWLVTIGPNLPKP